MKGRERGDVVCKCHTECERIAMHSEWHFNAGLGKWLASILPSCVHGFDPHIPLQNVKPL